MKNKTKLEKERLEIIVAGMPCYACFQDGKEVQCRSTSHQKAYRNGSQDPRILTQFHLCAMNTIAHGKVSVHLGKKAFINRYGTEQDILEKINREIEKCKEETQGIF
jgi:hypothetical protein